AEGCGGLACECVRAAGRDAGAVRVRGGGCVGVVPFLRVRLLGVGAVGSTRARWPAGGSAVRGVPVPCRVRSPADAGTGDGAEPDAFGVLSAGPGGGGEPAARPGRG